jgi:hypothetical protein
MAIIKPGIAIAGIRGKLGGIIFAENATSCYAKSYGRSQRTHSVLQVESRARMATSASAWSGLSSGEKADWVAFAADPNELDYDPWGDQRFLTGFQWFVRAADRRALVALEPSATTPSGAAAPAPTGLSADLYTPGSLSSSISWDSASFDTDYSAIIFAAMTPSTGATDLFTGWKLLLAKQNPGDTGEDVTDELLDVFGNFPAEWVCFIRVFSQAPYGNRSTVAVTSATIQA